MDSLNDLVSVSLTLEECSRLHQFCLGKVEELDVYLRCDILSSSQFSFVVERKRFYLNLASKLIFK